MNEQLLGVIVGALIGFTGSALITLLQSRMEKERRREERKWHYRQEHMQRLRPAWERLYGYLYEYILVTERLAKVLDSLAAVEQTERDERVEELRMELKKIAKSVSDVQQLKTQASELLTIVTTHDPELRKTIAEVISKALAAKDKFESDAVSLVDKYALDGELHAEEVAKLLKQLAQHRHALIEGIRQVEASIERYITDL